MKKRIYMLLLAGILTLPAVPAAMAAEPAQIQEQSLILIDETDPDADPIIVEDPLPSERIQAITVDDADENAPIFLWTSDFSACTATFPDSETPIACEVSSAVTKEATCTEEGTLTYTAKVVGTEYTDCKTVAIPKTAHTPIADKAVAATCEKSGLTEGSHCSVCGAILTAQKVIPATGHRWDSGVVNPKPTCTREGMKTYTCRNCQKTKKETIAKTAHQWGKRWVSKKATPTTNGVFSHTCTVCKQTKPFKRFPHPDASVTSALTYTGSVRHPSVRVVNTKGSRLNSKYYSVKYYTKNSKAPGFYSYKVTFQGDMYSGSMTGTYKIRPRSTVMNYVTAQKGGFQAQWTKRSSQISGYEIQYSLRRAASQATTKKVSSKKTNTLTVRGLKKGRTYYVRVRTYKTVGKKAVYSIWSEWTSVTTKS
ncbi:MAG: fibronectin type III domain-containing protein [Eubacteriales bacterium]|nr:fibronectin type III domain-containing protein [Eubacteriales bacterium]